MAESSQQIWKAFSSAIGAELREDTVIRGASGLEHEVQAIAVDEKDRRVIIVAAEADPRMAALVQVDVQSSMPDARVIVARPIAIDISLLARSILEPFNIQEIDFSSARKFMEELPRKGDQETKAMVAPSADAAVENIKKIFERVNLPAISQIVSVISQAEMLPWKDIGGFFDKSVATGKIDLRALLARDTIEADIKAGICPIPLYQFSENDFELFLDGRRIDECQELLKSIGIYQYFFPPPDQLALALVDDGIVNREAILHDTKLAPRMGHPFGEFEILDVAKNIKDVVDGLSDRKLIVDGEFGFEITPEGKSVRGAIKFSPREGFITKIINRISLSISPNDFLK